jgi:hypothetical protein
LCAASAGGVQPIAIRIPPSSFVADQTCKAAETQPRLLGGAIDGRETGV